MELSDRTRWDLEEDLLAGAVRRARLQGREVFDLTVSNPTTCGFDYDAASLLAPLANPAAMSYEPLPLGTLRAREAVAAYYRDHGAEVRSDRLCLTTSTSEAYSFLFRLLCNPGDEVLAASPSYPLFDYIAQLDDVVLREYPLLYDPNARAADTTAQGWSIDLHALEAAVTPRTKALLVVHPNNPTGNLVSDAEREALYALCERHRLALIVDEVFLDYGLTEKAATFAGGGAPCLTFVLSGVSKVCGLPQMKVSWIAADGPTNLVAAAMERLEVIADTYLSMNAPAQFALPTWLNTRYAIQQQILARVRANLATLDDFFAAGSIQRLAMQAGWTAVVRVPRTVEQVQFAEAALDRGVIVQPGRFYGLPEGRAVLSLLTLPETWIRGLERLSI